VGDGLKTLFWLDSWLGGIPLAERFPRLFDLFLNKLSTVAAMCDLGWEAGGTAWLWRRPLRAWEEHPSAECRLLLYDVVLQPHVANHWVWRHDLEGGYSVRGVYQLLTRREALHIAPTTI
jgi:hypothetical protein